MRSRSPWAVGPATIPCSMATARIPSVLVSRTLDSAESDRATCRARRSSVANRQPFARHAARLAASPDPRLGVRCRTSASQLDLGSKCRADAGEVAGDVADEDAAEPPVEEGEDFGAVGHRWLSDDPGEIRMRNAAWYADVVDEGPGGARVGPLTVCGLARRGPPASVRPPARRAARWRCRRQISVNPARIETAARRTQGVILGPGDPGGDGRGDQTSSGRRAGGRGGGRTMPREAS